MLCPYAIQRRTQSSKFEHCKRKGALTRLDEKLRRDVSKLFFCAVFKIWKQNLPLKCAISDVFLPNFTRCLPIAYTPNRQVCSRYWTWNYFSIKYSKFAVECDWNSKNSQNVQDLGFLGKQMGILKKKTFFFKINEGGKFAVQCLSNGIISWKCLFRFTYEVFLGRNQKFLKLGKVRKLESWKS